MYASIGVAQPRLSTAQTAPQTADGQHPVAGVTEPLSIDELKELDAIEADAETYERAAVNHEQRLRVLLYREYVDKRKELENRYRERLELTSVEQLAQRRSAIERLEEFLKRYPSHAEFTPDAMFRLADLYVDEANYQYENQLEAGGGLPPPTADDESFDADEVPYDGPDYSPALALWRGIVERFPKYRQYDGTLYLYGYYLGQVGKDRQSRQVYLALVCGNRFKPLDEPPPAPTREQIRAALDNRTAYRGYQGCESRSELPDLVQEAWVRGVGDAHFNTPGELPQAIAAYRKVAGEKDSKYYDEALYKLAWSYYRNDDFLLGIQAFDESVQEAIQYIAISFTDPWSVEEQVDPARALERADAFYASRYKERHVRDVYEHLGDTFRIIEAYPQAIDSWRRVLREYPLDSQNPKVHQKIVSALEATGDKDAADEEAARLATTYARGTEWYAANETNREAMESQISIGQHMLRATAENTHRAAQLARKDYDADPTPDNKQRYLELYARAANLYQQYLEQYPDSDEVYEFTYRIADTRFFSEQYADSVPFYRWVRDHRDLSEKYYLKAALSVVQARQAEVDQQLARGTLTEPPVPTAETLRALGTVEPLPIPMPYRDLRDAYDEYQQLVADPKTAPTMALAAALVSYRHLQLDDAIRRFQVVLQKFCGTDEATRAKDGLLVIYDARGQADLFTKTNQDFINAACGDDAAIALAQAQNRSMEFQRAERLFTSQEYETAALEFYRFYKTAPNDDPNLPLALYNSAIAYDRSGRPKTAIYLFEEFTGNPSKEFRASPYFVEALYLTAVAHQKAFDYQSAVDVYLKVVAVASEKDRPEPPGGRTLEQIRLDAMFNAALLRELDRVYQDPRAQPKTGAISLYRRYLSVEPDRRKQDRALWAVARVYESMQDYRAMTDTYDEWRRKFGRDPGNEQDYVFTYYNEAKAWAKKGVTRAADGARRETIKAWDTVGRPEGTPTASMAAELEFHYAEEFYNQRFERFKFSWPTNPTEKNVNRNLDNYDKLVTQAQEGFTGIGKYQDPLYGAAALVRIGDLQFFSAQALINAPPPKEITRLDERFPDKGILTAWQERIEQIVQPKIDTAVNQWKKVVSTAKAAGISNRWTQLAQERLHDFVNADEFPVLRDELVGTTEHP
jgi:TolA-binding protein